MATVYAARDPSLNREVAIKVIDPQQIYEDGVEARFRDEAKAAAALRHPHIVAIHSWGESDDLLWFAMDRLGGGSLRDLLQRNGRLPPSQVAQITGQIAGALHHAHRQGVYHRDIKPANILLDEQGHAFVADFGIAKAIGDVTLTDTGVAPGTPGYMSPEQLTYGRKITAASDQFSLGATLFELLTGERPFPGDNAVQISVSHERRMRGNLRRLAPECPPDLAALVERMLEPEPENRWPDLEVVRRCAVEIAVNGFSAFMGAEKRSRRGRRGALAAVVLGSLIVIGWVMTSADLPFAGKEVQTLAADSSSPTMTEAGGRGLVLGPETGSAGDEEQAEGPAEPPSPAPPSTPPLAAPIVRSAGDQRPGPAGRDAAMAADPPVSDTLGSVSPRTGPAYLRVGSRGVNVYLYINGTNPTRIDALEWLPISVFGRVNLSFRSEGCRILEETVTLQPGDSLTIGYRNPPCT